MFRNDGNIDLVTRSGVKVSNVSLPGAQISARDEGVVVSRTRPAESSGESGSATLVSVFFLGEAGRDFKGNFVVIDGASEISVMPAQSTLPDSGSELADLVGEIRFAAEDGKQRPVGYRAGFNNDGVVAITPESPLAREMAELRPDLVMALAMVELQKQTDIAIENIRVVLFLLQYSGR